MKSSAAGSPERSFIRSEARQRWRWLARLRPLQQGFDLLLSRLLPLRVRSILGW